MKPRVILDWSEENVTLTEHSAEIALNGKRYLVEWFGRDSETGGWDVVHMQAFDSIYGAMKYIMSVIDYESKLDKLINPKGE